MVFSRRTSEPAVTMANAEPLDSVDFRFGLDKAAMASWDTTQQPEHIRELCPQMESQEESLLLMLAVKRIP